MTAALVRDGVIGALVAAVATFSIASVASQVHGQSVQAAQPGYAPGPVEPPPAPAARPSPAQRYFVPPPASEAAPPEPAPTYEAPPLPAAPPPAQAAISAAPAAEPPLHPRYALPPPLPTGAAYPAAAAAPAGADIPPTWGETRNVGAHAFPRGSFVPSAVVTSHVGMRAGVAYHRVPGYAQLPSLVSSSSTQQVDLRTINVAETLDFGLRLHDHVGIFGEAYGRARIGANTATLLGDGADYTYGGDLGILIKLFRVQGFQLSLSGQLGAYTGQSAGIAALFQDLNAIARNTVAKVVSDPKFDLNKAVAQLNTAFRTATADLLTPFNGLKYGLAVNVAQSLGRYAGLQASFGYIADSAKYRPTHYDETLGGPVEEQRTITIARPAFGLALDIDTSHAGLPIALMLEYRMTPVTITDTDHPEEDTSSLEHLVALGMFYSGRTDLQLGVTAYTVAGQPPALSADSIPSGKPLDLALQLVFRYYW